ncbi:hypothetical protein [Pleurocapsa sp. FMAR1]|uniref:hypothetical protein n=1 Tax=Pleurocapsa sp. FMAR1 TaxID=3040204 RepID=UPI0029C96996|nr:hypothetical protein [Pleurocapsa sp. FMAR1]
MNQSIKNNLPQNTALPNLAENLGIKKLQTKISYLYRLEKTEEIHLLTALFVEHLADNLELIQKPTQIENSELLPLTCFPSLPINFPDSAEMPLFLYGDKVDHESIEDYGIVIGRFYAIDRSINQWRWKYLILNNADFTINSFFSSCICWETELEPLD